MKNIWIIVGMGLMAVSNVNAEDFAWQFSPGLPAPVKDSAGRVIGFGNPNKDSITFSGITCSQITNSVIDDILLGQRMTDECRRQTGFAQSVAVFPRQIPVMPSGWCHNLAEGVRVQLTVRCTTKLLAPCLLKMGGTVLKAKMVSDQAACLAHWQE